MRKSLAAFDLMEGERERKRGREGEEEREREREGERERGRERERERWEEVHAYRTSYHVQYSEGCFMGVFRCACTCDR